MNNKHVSCSIRRTVSFKAACKLDFCSKNWKEGGGEERVNIILITISSKGYFRMQKLKCLTYRDRRHI